MRDQDTLIEQSPYSLTQDTLIEKSPLKSFSCSESTL